MFIIQEVEKDKNSGKLKKGKKTCVKGEEERMVREGGGRRKEDKEEEDKGRPRRMRVDNGGTRRVIAGCGGRLDICVFFIINRCTPQLTTVALIFLCPTFFYYFYFFLLISLINLQVTIEPRELER